MYQLVSAIAKPRSGGGRWQSVDIGEIPMYLLYTAYSRIIATLSNNFLTHHVSLDLDAIRAAAAGLNISFAVYLTQNGNLTLPTSNTLFALNLRYAKYADAIHAGYKARPVHPSADPDAVYPASELTRLLLTKPDLDYVLFNQSCLVNVNGFFHQASANSTGVFVVDGNKSAQLSGVNHVGLLSFRELGTLSIIPITSEMVHKQSEAQRLKDRAFVDLGQDVSNKTVMLVLGGYLHVLDHKTLRRVSASCMAIDFCNLSLLDRYYQSKRYIDLSSLGLSTTPRNSEQIGLDEFYSDTALEAYLTLSQSFFVLLDNPEIFVERDYVQKTKLPDTFISHSSPEYPLVVDAGKIANYWYSHENGQYALRCHDSMRHNRLYDTINVKEAQSVSSARIPMRPVENSHAFFLKIGSQI